VATPATAATEVVPLRMPLLGASATVEVSPVTRLLNWSRTRTVTAGVMATPATVVVGSTPKTRWLAAAGVMSKLVEVARSGGRRWRPGCRRRRRC